MTALDIGAPAQPRYRLPDPASATPSTTPVITSPAGWDWDGRVDTLPLLRTTDIRSMERLRAIRDYAHRGMAEIDALLALLDDATGAGGPGVKGDSPR
ncbi:hypothetical protein [Nonomuraea aridisoli]|uniref:Uncharacterized protein n=1 Tax=Nonomuraea aridisoli TaxID=2070368 RepID=A0A2W2E1C9_9ACTN|nr:hypothetical protein [Nonomuraea aridisoli]PZG18036.1 hypothetical protein C1J01_16335 [Nonomuraea aridisoli]